MSVHYKFKSALDFDTISFDGLHISVDDLKKAIIHQKRLGKTQDFDLQITNAQTKEEYSEDSCLIPKNTSLIIARVPLTRQVKKSWDPNAEKAASSASARAHKNVESQAANVDLSQMNGTEEDKINAMMRQSTMDYDPHNYQKVRGAQVGEVPASYRCYKCQKTGHWIKNCPLNAHHEPHVEVKRNTGIPRSFIDAAAAGNSPALDATPNVAAEKKQEVPEDLICSICKDLFNDAVMIPCCGSSFCDECVRTALLESEDNECPDCNEKGSSPGSLIPNRFLRNSVNSFKNETGYNKPRQQKKVQQPQVTQSQADTQADESNIQPSPEATVTTTTPDVAPAVTASNSNDENADERGNSAEEKVSTAGYEDKNACDTPRTGTPHEESDFEDNITVTVPPPQLQSNNSYRDEWNGRHMNGRHQRHVRPPGMETPPKNPHVHHYQHSREEGVSTPNSDEKESYGSQGGMNPYGMQQQQQQPPPQHQMHHLQGHQMPQPHYPENHHYQQLPGPLGMQPQRSMPTNQYIQGPSQMPPQNQMPPAQIQYDSYGIPIQHNQSFQPHYQNQPTQGLQRPPFMRGGYHGSTMPPAHNPMMSQQMRPRNHGPLPAAPNLIASAYQGVARKIGPGIIDDPLEEFNRLMKEKERRKEERRTEANSPPLRRRSRSQELRRRSPIDRRRSPRRISPPDGRGRGRSPIDKRSRSRRRSASFHSRHSRHSRSFSRSRSRSMRRHSRSPIHRKRTRSPPPRRSRSRSGSFSVSRSRSRSHSLHSRKMKGITNTRFVSHRSPPLRASSPPRNNRYRDTGRREYRDRNDDYRERSPPPYHSGRGRGSYRGRGRGNFYRQERGGGSHQMHGSMHQQAPNMQPYYNQPANQMHPNTGVGYHDANYHDMQANRYPPIRDHSPAAPMHMNQIQPTHDYMAPIQTAPPMLLHPNYDNEPIPPYRAFDVAPPGTEPPPPGFENEPINRYSDDREWNAHNAIEKDRAAARTPEQKGTATPATPPDSRERHAGFNDEPNMAPNTRERRSISPRQPTHERRTRSNAADDRSKERRRHSRSPVRRETTKRENREESRHDRDKKDHEKVHRSPVRRETAKRENREESRHDRDKKDHEKAHPKDRERSTREPTREVADRKERHEKEVKRESSDDEKRRSKDKKKKKKEEKLLEKKKKKERKEKEKREKKAHSRDKSHNKDTAATSNGKAEEQLDDTLFGDNEKRETAIETTADPRSCTPPPLQQQAIQSTNDYEAAAEQPARTENEINEDDSNIDLYGDITSRNIEYPNEGADTAADEEIVSTGSPLQMNHLDSILDIHANLDFDENEMNEMEAEPTIKRTVNDVFAPIPELSKWERDDDLAADKKLAGDISPTMADQNQVTTEVLKRAENAIFARAINAIRPIEIKKISLERQKLYSNEKPEDEALLLGNEDVRNELETFQITVPVHSEQAERSVEIKAGKRNKTPIKSVKERLGRIVTDDLRSRSKTPPRKAAVDVHKDRRSRSRERRERSTGRNSRRDKDSAKRDASNDRRNNRKDDSRSRQRDSSRDRKGDNTNRRDNRDIRSTRDSRDNRTSRDNRREDSRNKSRERENLRNTGRDDHRRQMEKNTRDIIRERDLDKAREMARIRERERVKELERKTASADGSSAKSAADKEKAKDNKKNVSNDRSRSDRSNKPSPGESKIEDHKDESGRNKASISSNPFERKKTGIDEANFVPDYDENMGEENPTAETSKKSGKATESKATATATKKRTRSESASSSSSDSNSSDSESESEDRKRKKRKHKKQKKSKRASSSGSDESTSKKKKRKSKKSKKKKKTKK